MTPALIQGNVAPSNTDCGKIKALAISHFTTMRAVVPVRAGKMVV
jgi:hypothetical protein